MSFYSAGFLLGSYIEMKMAFYLLSPLAIVAESGLFLFLVGKMCKTSDSGNQLSGMMIQLQASSIKDNPITLF